MTLLSLSSPWVSPRWSSVVREGTFGDSDSWKVLPLRPPCPILIQYKDLITSFSGGQIRETTLSPDTTVSCLTRSCPIDTMSRSILSSPHRTQPPSRQKLTVRSIFRWCFRKNKSDSKVLRSENGQSPKKSTYLVLPGSIPLVPFDRSLSSSRSNITSDGTTPLVGVYSGPPSVVLSGSDNLRSLNSTTKYSETYPSKGRA